MATCPNLRQKEIADWWGDNKTHFFCEKTKIEVSPIGGTFSHAKDPCKEDYNNCDIYKSKEN